VARRRESGIGIDQWTEPNDSPREAAQQQRRTFVERLLRGVGVGPISFAVSACDNQRRSLGGKEVVGFTVYALTLELDASRGSQVTVAANSDMPDNSSVSADPGWGICWVRHEGIVMQPRRMKSPQNCRIQAISLDGADAQASCSQANLDEESHVGARDEHHRANEQEGNRPRKSGAKKRIGKQRNDH
jgi:hypothetical protein